jgi:hypothetical protein
MLLRKFLNYGLIGLLVFSKVGFAFEINQFFDLFNLSSSRAQVTDNLAWEALKRNPNASANVNQLLQLAKENDHPLAKVFVGCMYANGLGVPVNKSIALNYLSSVSQQSPLALYNWGIVRLSVQAQDRDGWLAVEESYRRKPYKESAATLLYYQMNTNKVDEKMVSALMAAKNPSAYYYQGQKQFALGNYTESANLSKVGADMGDPNNMLLLSNSYAMLAKSLPGYQKLSLFWKYLYQYYSGMMALHEFSDQVLSQNQAELTSEVTAQVKAEAKRYIETHQIKKPVRFEANCDVSDLLGA